MNVEKDRELLKEVKGMLRHKKLKESIERASENMSLIKSVDEFVSFAKGDMNYNVSEKFRLWWAKYDDVEKCRLVKDKSIELNKKHKSMVKASDSEFRHTGHRTGIRGGKLTTLSARAQNATESYLNALDELKYMIATL
jgi:hypothetical protein